MKRGIAFQHIGATLLVFGLALSLGACKGKKDQPIITPDMTESAFDSGMETSSGEGMPELNEDWLFRPANLKTIYFDYDSYDLRPDALATLSENADAIKKVPDAIIQIEGHCDERGTQEYNLALGEKRALATRSHLMNLGVSGDRIITISYGEEDPEDPRSTEDAWAKNRRAEFNRAVR